MKIASAFSAIGYFPTGGDVLRDLVWNSTAFGDVGMDNLRETILEVRFLGAPPKINQNGTRSQNLQDARPIKSHA